MFGLSNQILNNASSLGYLVNVALPMLLDSENDKPKFGSNSIA